MFQYGESYLRYDRLTLLILVRTFWDAPFLHVRHLEKKWRLITQWGRRNGQCRILAKITMLGWGYI